MILALLVMSLLPQAPLPESVIVVDSRLRWGKDQSSIRLRLTVDVESAEEYGPDGVLRFRGAPIFEVWRGGTGPTVTEFPDEFCCYRNVLTPLFQDLNHDGRPDFVLCYCGTWAVPRCRIFTIEDNGTVSWLSIGTTPMFDPGEASTTPIHFQVTHDGFCFHGYGADRYGVGAYGKRCVRWRRDLGQFEFTHDSPTLEVDR
jgi:hypothetical protein